MAANLKRYMRIGCYGLLLMAAIPVPAMAEEMLVDPTRPADMAAKQPGGGVDTGLQSIIISPTRRAAIIRGQTVELGGKVGDVRLIEVNEGGVVLQGDKGLEVLTLFPNVKISRKATVLPMSNEIKHPARKTDQAGEPVGQAGKKEEK